MLKSTKRKLLSLAMIASISVLSLQPTFAYVKGEDFVSYNQTSIMKDAYHYRVGSVSLRNSTSSPITLKYVQQETVTTTGSFTANVTANAEFKAAFFSKISASIGITAGVSKTTTSSTTVEFTTSVPVGKLTTITKYLAGVSSGGTVTWRSTYSQTDPNFIGPLPPHNYSEPASGWSVAQNEVNYKVTESN